MFQNSAQHDSQEALLCILDTLNEEIGSETFLKSNNSIFDDKIKYLLDKDELDEMETKNLINLIKSNEEQYVNFISQNDFTKFYKKKYSFICNMFGGRIISGLNCPITNISKINFEPFFFLSVSIPDESELESDSESESDSELSFS